MHGCIHISKAGSASVLVSYRPIAMLGNGFMMFAQISDLHIGAPGAVERLDETLTALSALDDEIDLLLLTGDLTEAGESDDYVELLRKLIALQKPLVPVVGNHDNRLKLVEVFSSVCEVALDPSGFVQYAVNVGDLRVIVLDTKRASSAQPQFCEARHAWLERELAQSRSPVLIAMHHPPIQTGVEWVDAEDADWQKDLGSLLSAHASRIVGIVCGHVHRTIFAPWRGLPVVVAPATFPQVALRLGEGRGRSYSEEPPGFLLHRWDGKALFSYAGAAPGFEADTDPYRGAGDGA